MSLVWQVFEPLLFGLVGAEVSVEYMNTKVVGKFKYDIRAEFKWPLSRSQSLFENYVLGAKPLNSDIPILYPKPILNNFIYVNRFSWERTLYYRGHEILMNYKAWKGFYKIVDDLSWIEFGEFLDA